MTNLPKNFKKIGILGLQNVGKSSIFNLLINFKKPQDIGNWSGVTTEIREEKVILDNEKYIFFDLPGNDFLNNTQINEKKTINWIFKRKCNFFINVIDGLHFEENIYFTLLLKELNIPFLLIINFADKFDKMAGINVGKLENILCTKILIISAIDENYKDKVKKFIFTNRDLKFKQKTFFYSDEITKLYKKIKIKLLSAPKFISYLKKKKFLKTFYLPYVIFKIIEKNNYLKTTFSANDIDIKNINDIIISYERYNLICANDDLEMRRKKYLENVLNETTTNINKNQKSIKWTLKIDRIFLNRYFGLPIMLILLFMVFVLIFNFTIPYKDFLTDIFIIYLPHLLKLNVNTIYGNFIQNGIFNSLGIMLSFLPLLYGLFFVISIVKQTGLMSRISFMFEGLFNKIGLNGKSIIPLFLGFGCNVTSIFSSRIINNYNQRKSTALMSPFMSCSARIVVFSLFSSVFFPNISLLIIIFLYLVGIFVAIIIGMVMKCFFWYSNDSISHSSIHNLPQYNKIKWRMIFRITNKNIIGYIKGIFSVIFIFIVILWFLNYFPIHNPNDKNASILGHLSGVLMVIFKPLGFGIWGPLCIALIPAIVAKETAVAAIALLLGNSINTGNGVSVHSFFTLLLHTVENSFIYLLPNHWFNNELYDINSNSGIGYQIRNEINIIGMQNNYSAGLINLGIFSYMLFILLTIPCIATLGAIYKEFDLKTMLQSLALGIFVPYFFSLIIFQMGHLFIK